MEASPDSSGEEEFSVRDGKEDSFYKTQILDRFLEGGMMKEISRKEDNPITRITYMIRYNGKRYIFKSIICPLKDRDACNFIKKELEINKKAVYASNGIVSVLDYKTKSTSTKRFVMEILYKCAGEDLLSLVGKIGAGHALRIMTSFARTLSELEKYGINHYDIKPSNLIVRDEEVLLIDFGTAREFNKRANDVSTTTIKGQTYLYSPPELLHGQRGRPAKIDVFCWGMTLYHVVGNKEIKDLEKDQELRGNTETYSKFLENISNIQIADDVHLTRKIRAILLSVLSEIPTHRPTFEELLQLLGNDEKILELERSQTEERNRRNNSENELDRLVGYLPDESREIRNRLKNGIALIKGKGTLCNLHSVGIEDRGAEILASTLNESTELEELNLGFNKIGVEGIEALAKGLEKCKKLKKVILGKAKKVEERKLGTGDETSTEPDGEQDDELNSEGNNTNSNEENKDARRGGNEPSRFRKVAGYALAGVGGAGIATGTAIGLAKLVSLKAIKTIPVIKSAVSAIAAVPGVVAGSIIVIGAVVLGFGFYLIFGSRPSSVPESPPPREDPPPQREVARIRVDDPDTNNQNNLAERGTKAIANALKNSAWEHLDLSYCNISKEAIEYLKEIVNNHRTLRFISIKGNPELNDGDYNFRCAEVEY